MSRRDEGDDGGINASAQKGSHGHIGEEMLGDGGFHMRAHTCLNLVERFRCRMGRFLSTAPPSALGDIAISIDPQEAAGREDFHPLSDLTPSRHVSCRQVADQRLVGEGWPSTLQERPDLGCERKGVGSLFAKVKWLDSHPVPHKVEGSAGTVENGECKHPTHVRQAGFSEFLPGFEQCLRIRVPAPRQERELLAKFKMVVNFTIKNDHKSPAGADHRLCPCVGEFQD